MAAAAGGDFPGEGRDERLVLKRIAGRHIACRCEAVAEFHGLQRQVRVTAAQAVAEVAGNANADAVKSFFFCSFFPP